MQSLQDILKKILGNNTEFQEKQKELALFEAWPLAVGELIAGHAQPVRFLEKGVLLVTCNSSSWLQQMNYLAPALIKKLNAQAKETLVREIRFRLSTETYRKV